MSQSVSQPILHGPLAPALLRFALPVLVTLFLQALYGAVDLWAVGHFASPEDMSAVSTGSQAMLIPNGLFAGLGMGITVLAGTAAGAGNRRALELTWLSAQRLFLFMGLFCTVALPLSAPWIVRLFNIPDGAFEQAVDYLRICGLGSLLLAGFNGYSGLYRGLGDSLTPLLIVLLASVANIVGDLFLVSHCQLGARGAALATVAAQAFSVILFHVHARKLALPFRGSCSWHHYRALIATGGPVAIQETGNELFYMILIGLTNTLGVIAAAGVGVAEKLIIFLLLIPIAYVSAITAFVAQNVGAGNIRRARQAMGTGLAFATVSGAAVSAVLFFHGDLLSLIFVRNEPEVIAASAVFLRATALECLLLAMASSFSGYFNGLGRTRFVMAQNLVAILLVKLPTAYLALKFATDKLLGIGLSAVWGALFSLLVSLIYYWRLPLPPGRLTTTPEPPPARQPDSPSAPTGNSPAAATHDPGHRRRRPAGRDGSR